jgi:hypothetical protein
MDSFPVSINVQKIIGNRHAPPKIRRAHPSFPNRLRRLDFHNNGNYSMDRLESQPFPLI